MLATNSAHDHLSSSCQFRFSPIPITPSQSYCLPSWPIANASDTSSSFTGICIITALDDFANLSLTLPSTTPSPAIAPISKFSSSTKSTWLYSDQVINLINHEPRCRLRLNKSFIYILLWESIKYVIGFKLSNGHGLDGCTLGFCYTKNHLFTHNLCRK